ncbi:hypothetical protein HMPREF0542_11805 [Ligilactobacillus ruminis ATCC 25644]|uniref:Uncharacterized protein n=1 Tax=Ligilactobacillus ruminis ATCC 25644 TaxID=525362 RepID=E7FSC8_9LACO|nr:hypothetical protein HMPREF0542_11805 [Ligilactobacillus ruminis ATCC 25644]
MIKPPYYVFVKNNKKIIANKVYKVYKNAHASRLDSYMNMSSETNLVGCFCRKVMILLLKMIS